MLDKRQVAELLGVSYRYIDVLRARSRTGRVRPPFPDPDRTYGRTPMWYRKTIVGWQKARKR